MAIVLEIDCKLVDTEPTNPMANGIILRSARITTMMSETDDMGGILLIAKTRVADELDEVRVDIHDQIDVVSRQA